MNYTQFRQTVDKYIKRSPEISPDEKHFQRPSMVKDKENKSQKNLNLKQQISMIVTNKKLQSKQKSKTLTSHRECYLNRQERFNLYLKLRN